MAYNSPSRWYTSDQSSLGSSKALQIPVLCCGPGIATILMQVHSEHNMKYEYNYYIHITLLSYSHAPGALIYIILLYT